MDARLADGAEISFEQEARSSERQNDLIGIDLPDQTLQPESLSITARLAGEGLIHVQISGRFWLYKADAEQPDGRVPVRAEFDARIVPGKQ